MSTSAASRSWSVVIRWASTPARRIASARAVLAGADLGGEAAAQQRVAGVDEELLAGLRVLDQDQAEVGQLQLGRVDHADHHHLVAVGEPGQRTVPVRGRR